jgi:hypothetical protein
MTIFNRFIARFRVLPLLLAFSFIVAACGQAAQPTATMTPPPTSAPTSTPVIEIALDFELPEADPEVGLNRAVKFRCFGCHVQNPNGLRFDSAEDLPSIMERGVQRIADPAYEGTASTNLEYIFESILLTEIYIVPGDWEKAMPTYLGDIMTEQDLADVIAWMSTFE